MEAATSEAKAAWLVAAWARTEGGRAVARASRADCWLREGYKLAGVALKEVSRVSRWSIEEEEEVSRVSRWSVEEEEEEVSTYAGSWADTRAAATASRHVLNSMV